MRSDTKPTAGPWIVEPHEEHPGCFYISSANAWEMVARLFGIECRPFDSAKANARLIAQAPALLALAEKVAKMHEDTDSPVGIEARTILRSVRGEE